MAVPGVADLPDSEDMNSRCPLPRFTITGASACASTIGARRLTSSTRSISSIVNDSSRPEPGSAALARRMSTSPESATRRSTAAASLRSTASVRAPSSSAASGSRISVRRPVRIRSPPRACSARAIAWPRPPVAPVSRTVEPEICMSWEPTSMRIIALFGPTGVGKTAVALALARRLRARGEDPVAVSADALQVYEGLQTLTGVASPAERAELEHRLVAFVPLDARFSVGEYAQLAHAEIDGLLAQGRRPIVVGGTGLYLRAALAELDFKPPPPEGQSQP